MTDESFCGAIIRNAEALGGKNVSYDAAKQVSFQSLFESFQVTKLTMLSGSEFQTVGGATEKARLAKTVRVTRNGQPRCVRSVATSLITLDI